MASTRSTPTALRIGVLMEEVQLADIVGIDIFGNASMAMANQASDAMGPIENFPAEEQAAHKERLANAIDITWYFLGPSTTSPSTTTPGLSYLPNCTYADCPRDLDIVIVGGNFPTCRPEGATQFVREAWKTTRVWLTVCTGSMWIASTGVMKGINATTNRGAVAAAKMMYPDVKWVEQRWVVVEKEFEGEGKGELWTGAGAGAGIDMIAAYAMKNFGESYTRRALLPSLEFDPAGPRGQFYPDVKAA